MRRIEQRAYAGSRDLEDMGALVYMSPANNLHVADLPYRLSSWALDYPDNIGLWIDENQLLVGWAILQTPFWTIDYACHPKAEIQVHQQILAWADKRAQRILDTPAGRPMWFVNVFTRQAERIRDLEEAGFVSQANVSVDPWTKVLLQRSGVTPVQKGMLPKGFIIRPLAGEHEIDAYVDLHQTTFESKNMTHGWRRRTLQQSEYVPDLDLVAVAPDGYLAAFCICWLHRSKSEVRGQIEPLGVHRDFRKLGLGRGILSEGLQRLQRHGAHTIYVETDNYRDEAFALYKSAGFRVAEDVLVYRKDYRNLSTPQ